MATVNRRSAADVLKGGRIVALASAGIIFLAAVVDALLFFGVTAGNPPNPFFFDWQYSRAGAVTNLEQEYLVDVWLWNLKAFPSLLASDFLLSIGLFGVAFVAWVLTKAYRALGGLAAKIMFLFFAIGAIVPAVGFLQNMGSTTAGDYIFTEWQDPRNFYQTEDVLVSLELSFLISTGRSVWIQALLYVLLGGGFWFCGFLGLIHSSELRANRLPRLFNLFSFFIGFFGYVVFAADVAKFFQPVHSFYGYATVIYMVLLIPAWTVWLGLILPRIPGEFMKGAVVATGPAYAELGEVRADEMSVEMEETPRSVDSELSGPTRDEENVVEDETPEVVEIKL